MSACFEVNKELGNLIIHRLDSMIQHQQLRSSAAERGFRILKFNSAVALKTAFCCIFHL